MSLSSSEFSLMNFTIGQFFGVLIGRKFYEPNFTTLCKIAETLIALEDTPETKLKEEVEWISEHTHKKINEPLSIVEMIVFKNLNYGLNKEVELGNKEFTLAELYKLLDEVSTRLMRVVIKIAKKYSLEIPIGKLQSAGNMVEFGLATQQEKMKE